MGETYLITKKGIEYINKTILETYRKNPEKARLLAKHVGLDLEAFLDEHDPERRMKQQHNEGPYR